MAGQRSNDSVDVPVQAIFQPRPEFPEKLAFNGRESRVWMSYVVDSTGLCQTGTLRALLSDDPLFTQAVINAVLHSKFRPALRQSRPVRQRVLKEPSGRAAYEIAGAGVGRSNEALLAERLDHLIELLLLVAQEY